MTDTKVCHNCGSTDLLRLDPTSGHAVCAGCWPTVPTFSRKLRDARAENARLKLRLGLPHNEPLVSA